MAAFRCANEYLFGLNSLLIRKGSFIGTHVTWGLNFRSGNVSNAIAEAHSITRAFASQEIREANIVLDLIEVGNEPDFYYKNATSWVDT